jgi:hypothetical protein
MNRKTIEKISKSIYRQFPEVNGSMPKVINKNASIAKGLGQKQTYLLTFSGAGQDERGRKIARTVRVTADEHGNIMKVSTSR